MAFNWQTFKTRALTALVFVAVMLLGLMWNHWSFFILFSVIHFGCWREYQRIIGLIDTEYASITPFHKYGVMLAGWCIMLYFTNDAFTIGDIRLHALGWWMGLLFVFVLPIIELLFARHIQLKNIKYSALGLLYISLSCGLMINLRSNYNGTGLDTLRDTGIYIPVGLILAIWINDTMAYIVGSLIGKTPFSKISPKKTWEGTLGGVVLCIGMVYGASLIKNFFPYGEYHPGADNINWAIIAGIAAVMGTAGDLLESKLKRMAGVKDSGQLMPGHGGFLDRFDSLLIATPFVWLMTLFM